MRSRGDSDEGSNKFSSDEKEETTKENVDRLLMTPTQSSSESVTKGRPIIFPPKKKKNEEIRMGMWLCNNKRKQMKR